MSLMNPLALEEENSGETIAVDLSQTSKGRSNSSQAFQSIYIVCYAFKYLGACCSEISAEGKGN